MFSDYHIVGELDDVVKFGFWRSPFGANHIGRFVNEKIQLENEMIFSRNTDEEKIISDDDENHS